MENEKMGILDKLIGSFDTTPNGFSARKLSAFIAITVGIVATFKYANEGVFLHTLMVWLTFAMLCLGIVTAEQILKFKGGESSVAAKKNEEPKI